MRKMNSLFILSIVTLSVAIIIIGSRYSILVLPQVQAQSSAASLTIIVEDSNKARISGAKIALINTETNHKREGVTNSDGYYTFTPIQPQKYSLIAEKEGFSKTTIKDLVLNVGDRKSLSIKLDVGIVGGDVTIDGGTSALQQDDASVGTVIDRKFIENMPLNGKSFQSLLALTPSVIFTKPSGAEAGQFSVNGQRGDANNLMIDGVSANFGIGGAIGAGQQSSGGVPGLSALGTSNNLVSVDALQEFRVLTSTFAPEYGRTPGGQILAVTRPGTNSFHGSIFNYLRNDALDANDWFANSLGRSRSALRQNNFGGVLGGPVIFPSFKIKDKPFYDGHDRTFFFFSYEGNRLRLPQTLVTEVPTLFVRANAPVNLRPYLNAYPLPNGRELTGARAGLAEFTAGFSNPSTFNATSLRIDHSIGSRVSIFGRYNISPSGNETRGNSNTSLSTISSTKANSQTLTLGSTILIAPRINLDTRANYSTLRAQSNSRLTDFGGAIPLVNLNFPNGISVDDSTLSFNIHSSGKNTTINKGKHIDNIQHQFNIVSTLALDFSSHQFKFGFDYRRMTPELNPFIYRQVVNFSGIGITPPNVPAPTRSVLSGKVFQATVFSNDPVDVEFKDISTFWQDTWRANQRLTLTYGVRWEFNTPPKGLDKELYTAKFSDNPANTILASAGTPLYDSKLHNFAPRFGLAYKISEQQRKSVLVRAGAGIFYDMGRGVLAQAASIFPYSRNRPNPGAGYPLDSSLAAPLPFSTTPSGSSIFVVDPDYKLPYTIQWNLAVEHSLFGNDALTWTYTGAAGRRLLRMDYILNPNKSFSQIFYLRTNSDSDYNALQIQYNKRLSRGLQVLASYTWSKSIDNASANSVNFGRSDRFDINQERGVSDFDIQHAFNTAISFDLPKFQNRNRLLSIFQDWGLDTMINARSADVINVTVSRLVGTDFTTEFRPDLVLNVPIWMEDPKAGGGRRINPDAFSMPAANKLGTLGRNSLRGFPAYQFDFALRRNFKLREGVSLQFRTEVFNILNHPNFGSPTVNDLMWGSDFGTIVRNERFGYSTQMLNRSLGSGVLTGGLSPLYQFGGPRSIQFSLKLKF